MPNKRIKTLRDDICQFIVNKKDEIVAVKDLTKLYHKYIKYKNLKMEVIYNYKDHEILYFLLEKLYVANCKDLDLISTVIKRMHAERIWFNSIISDLFNESKKFETGEIVELLEYCLKYANKKKMLFNGTRMATLPHFFHLLFPKKYYTPCLLNVIEVLLQYGMLLDPITGHIPSLDNSRTYLQLIPSISRDRSHDWSALWHSIIEEGILKQNPKLLPVSELPEKQQKVMNISVEIANLCMRDSVQFKFTDFYLSMAQQKYYEANPLDPDQYNSVIIVPYGLSDFSRINEENFIQRLGQFIPELPHRCLEPMSLKYGCKRTIRKLLHLNWQLPCGIFKLGLPKMLTRYLNLEIN